MTSATIDFSGLSKRERFKLLLECDLQFQFLQLKAEEAIEKLSVAVHPILDCSKELVGSCFVLNIADGFLPARLLIRFSPMALAH